MNEQNNKIITCRKILIIVTTIFILSICYVFFAIVWNKTYDDIQKSKEERILKYKIVREFIEDKVIIAVDAPDSSFFNDIHDITITIKNVDGTEETKTFKQCAYFKSESADKNWHITVSDNYISIYEPLTYTSK